MKKYKYRIILLIIAVLQMVWIVYFGNLKEGYHIDEIYSYSLSNGYYAPLFDANGDYWNEWHEKGYLWEYVSAPSEHRFAYDSVYYNQKMDVHPILYYYILHTICSFFPGVFSKWFALSINCVFSALTLVVLYKLAKKVLHGNQAESLILCTAYAFSAGAMSNAVYLRMYVMLTFFTVLYAYFHLLMYEGEKMYLPIIFCIIGGGLTHYYFYVFAFFISAFYCIYCLTYRKIKEIIYYVISTIGAVGINVIIFPSTIVHIFKGYRGKEAVENLQSRSIFESITEYFPYINNEMFGGLLKYIILLTLLAICIIVAKKYVKLKRLDNDNVWSINIDVNNNIIITNEKYGIISVAITVICYIVIVTTVSTVNADRYIFCTYPFIVVFSFMLLHSIYKALGLNIKYYLLSIVCICIMVVGVEYKKGYVNYLYQGYDETGDNIAQYSDLDVIYITDLNVVSIYRDMVFVDRSNRFIPVYYTDFELTLKDIYSEKKDEGILVYINIEYEPQIVFDALQNELGYSQFEQIAETYQSRVYLCR